MDNVERRYSLVVFFIFINLSISSGENLVDRILDSANQMQGVKKYLYFANRMSKVNNIYPDTLWHYSQEALEYSKEIDHLRLKGIANLIMANYYNYISKYVESHKHANEAIQIFEKEMDSLNMIRALNEKAFAFRLTGRKELALKVYGKALFLAEKLENRKVLHFTKLNVALLLGTVNKEKSQNIFREVIKNSSPDNYEVRGVAYRGLGSPYLKQAKNDSSLIYLKKAVDAFSAEDNLDGIASVYSDLAYYYFLRSELDSSDHYLDSVFRIKNSLGDILGLAHNYIMAANMKIRAGELKKAELYLNQADSIMKQNGISIYHDLWLKAVVQLLIERQDFKKALGFAISIVNESDSIMSLNNERLTEVLQTEYNLEKRSNKIKSLKQKIKIENLKRNQIIIGAVSLVFSLLVLLLSIRNKRKKEKLIAERDAEILGRKIREKEIAASLRKQMLLQKSLELIDRTTFISKIGKSIKKMIRSDNEVVQKELQRLNSYIRTNEKQTKDWVQFNKIFSQLSPSFFDDIASISGRLTKSEKKLSALIKLGYSPKDCAQILHISADSLKTSRYRFKKKLRLGKHDNLDEFIKSI